MKLTTLITAVSFLTTAFAANKSLVKERNEQLADLPVDKQFNATLQGILRSILAHRDFGSESVMFSTWRNVNDELYIVPALSEDDIDSAAMGLGYKLITDSNSVVRTSNTKEFLNVLEIKEEDISSMGFPKLFSKDFEDGMIKEDYFPSGARKFMLIGNKSSIDYSDNEEVNDSGLFNWWGREDDDDCDINSVDTDHFLFVGVDSIKENQWYENDEDDDSSLNIQNEIVFETEYTTVHTTVTTTVTATKHGETLPEKTTKLPLVLTTSAPGGEFEFRLPDNGVKEVPMTTAAPVKQILVDDGNAHNVDEVIEEITVSKMTMTTHEKPTHVDTTNIATSEATSLSLWKTIEVESPEFNGSKTKSSAISPSSMHTIMTKIYPSVKSSSAIHFYSDYKLMSSKGMVSMTRGFNSSNTDLLNNGTIPNNGFGSFEIQPWNSFFGIVCLMATLVIFV